MKTQQVLQRKSPIANDSRLFVRLLDPFANVQLRLGVMVWESIMLSIVTIAGACGSCRTILLR